MTEMTNQDGRQPQVAISLAKKALEVGERLRDGTVVISVDLETNTALFAPEDILVGYAPFRLQDLIVRNANISRIHGYSDWRRITDDEGETLCKIWDKVTLPIYHGDDAPWFWFASGLFGTGRVGKRGVTAWLDIDEDCQEHVPVVRNGPAWR